MRLNVFLMLCLMLFSCENASKGKETPADKALSEGFVFVDESERIVHWDKACNRAIQKVMLLKDVRHLHVDTEYCSCIPVPKMKEIQDVRGAKTKRH